MIKLLKRLWKDESGQGMAEYGLILALVAVVSIAAFTLLGSEVAEKVQYTGDKLEAVETPAETE